MAAPIGGPMGAAILLAICSIPSLKAAWSGLDISVINAYVAETHIPTPPREKGYVYNQLSNKNFILQNHQFIIIISSSIIILSQHALTNKGKEDGRRNKNP